MANPENGGDMQEQWLFRNRKKSPRLFRQFFLGITRWKSTGFSSPLDRWRWDDDEVCASILKVWEWLVWHFEGAYKTARRSRKGDSRRKTEKKSIVSESTLFVFFEVASPWPFLVFGLKDGLGKRPFLHLIVSPSISENSTNLALHDDLAQVCPRIT